MRGPEGAPAHMPGRRQWERSCARDEAEQARRRVADMARPRPSRSVVAFFYCACGAVACPSQSRNRASCHACGRPRPGAA